MKELLELEAKNAISIEEEIEMERKKVDAKTPITEEVGHPLGSMPMLACLLGSSLLKPGLDRPAGALWAYGQGTPVPSGLSARLN